MLGDFHPAAIKHLLKETIAAISLFAPCAIRVDCLSNIHYLVRVQCHDFSLASYLVKLASMPRGGVTGPEERLIIRLADWRSGLSADAVRCRRRVV